MGEIEEKLKTFILSKHKSISDFSKFIDIPYTTVYSILKRGVNKANVLNIIKICKALGISTDELAEGRIVVIKNNLKKEIAKNILLYRTNKGFDQKKLAEKINVTPSLISEWETGEKTIDMDTLYEICTILDVPLVDMFGKFASHSSEIYSSEEKNIILKVRQLNSDGKNYILRQFDYALQQDDFLFETHPTYNVEEKEY